MSFPGALGSTRGGGSIQYALMERSLSFDLSNCLSVCLSVFFPSFHEAQELQLIKSNNIPVVQQECPE